MKISVFEEMDEVSSNRRTSIYLVPYHSEPGLHLAWPNLGIRPEEIISGQITVQVAMCTRK
jgi:hypothetical protein